MAKKIKFLKDHLRHKAGEKALITDEAANYFIKCGVAVELKSEPVTEIKEEKPKVSLNVKSRKKK